MSTGDDQQGQPQTPLDMLGILGSQQAMLSPGLRHIELYARRGLMGLLWHEPTGQSRNVGVLMMGGAMGGLMGPGDALYHVLGEDFARRGIPAMRLSYRVPNDMDRCVVDAAAAVQMLIGTGCEHVIVMGHSFGGAVAVRVAVALPQMVCGVFTFATQTAGCEIASGLQGRPFLLFHGDQDEILPLEASQIVREMAGCGELRVMPGDGHLLSRSHDIMREETNAWCDAVFMTLEEAG